MSVQHRVKVAYKKYFMLVIICFSSIVTAYGIEGIVNDDDVRVRTLPVLESSTIVGTVGKGERVRVIGKSTFIQKIGNMNTRWVQIEWKEKSVWIYGYFVNVISEKGIMDIPIVVLYDKRIPHEEFSFQEWDNILQTTSLYDETLLGKTYNTNTVEKQPTAEYVMSASIFDPITRIKIGLGVHVFKYNNHINIFLLQSKHLGEQLIRHILDYKIVPMETEYTEIAYADMYGMEQITIDEKEYINMIAVIERVNDDPNDIYKDEYYTFEHVHKVYTVNIERKRFEETPFNKTIKIVIPPPDY